MLNLIILLLTTFELNKDYYYINKLSVKYHLKMLYLTIVLGTYITRFVKLFIITCCVELT